MADWNELAGIAAQPASDQRCVAVRGDERIAHARFVRDVAAWQQCFAAHAGERVALYFSDSYDFAAALFGAWHAGKTVVLPGDPQPETVERLAAHAELSAGELPGAIALLGLPSEGVSLAPLDVETTRLVLFTSGSSGVPVAIDKRLAQLAAEVRALQQQFGAGLEAATTYATVSHQHIYGLLFVVLWPLAAGRPFVAQRLAFPEEMAQCLGPEPSVLVSSPAHLKRLPDALDWRNACAGLRAVFSSGGVLPVEAAASCFTLLQTSPIEVFGSSETGGVAWRQQASHGERWQPLPGVAWRCEGDVLQVRSAHIGQNNWFATSDQAKAVADGSGFILRGRVDRIAKIEEKRVSLSAIERALCESPDIEDARAVVLGEPGAEKLAAVVVPTAVGWATLRSQGRRAFNEHLRARLLHSVERVVLPRSWRHVVSLPVNAQGKTTAAQLATLFRPYLPAVEWLQREPEAARAMLDVTAELIVFDGHFTDAPLVPGVAQLDWAVEFARSCFALQGDFQRCEVLKFQLPVLPGTALQLDLQWSVQSGALGFSYSSVHGAHASGRIVFAEAA